MEFTAWHEGYTERDDGRDTVHLASDEGASAAAVAKPVPEVASGNILGQVGRGGDAEGLLGAGMGREAAGGKVFALAGRDAWLLHGTA